MARREFSKCVRCGTTIDVTNQDIDICVSCSERQNNGGKQNGRRNKWTKG